METKLSWNPRTLQNEIKGCHEALNKLGVVAGASLPERVAAINLSDAKEREDVISSQAAEIESLKLAATASAGEIDGLKKRLETVSADTNFKNEASKLMFERLEKFNVMPKLAVAEDAKPEEKVQALGLVSLADQFAAIDNAVTAALARQNVSANTLPVATSSQSTATKTITRAEFDALKPSERMSFVKARGKITD